MEIGRIYSPALISQVYRIKQYVSTLIKLFCISTVFFFSRNNLRISVVGKLYKAVLFIQMCPLFHILLKCVPFFCERLLNNLDISWRLLWVISVQDTNWCHMDKCDNMRWLQPEDKRNNLFPVWCGLID